MSKKLTYKEIDWTHYLTRPKEFFLTNILVKDFKGTKLKKVFGFGHNYWLFLYNGGETMDLYRRVDELQESDKFAKEIIKDELKMRKFFDVGRRVVKSTEIIIEEYKNRQNLINDLLILKEEYRKAIDQIIDYFIYIIEIPYIVGGIFETDNSVDKIKYEWILKECEYFRSFSHYPDFHQYVLSYLLDSLADVLKSDRGHLALTTSDEISGFLNNEITADELLDFTEKRKQKFLCFSAFGKENFFNDDLFLESFYQDIDKSVKEFKGNIAYKGKVTAKVKIIISKNDFAKFNDGDVLVTIQSNPSFMPVIAKCAAIVADEGGIMSHAAIVSRELRKPCIIGTKIATKVLKDGDLVEVDADGGIVRKL